MSAAGSAEEPGILQRHDQGCVESLRGLECMTFLYRLRLVCSSLLHLRSQWKVNSANFALTTYSEVGPTVPESLGQMLFCRRTSMPPSPRASLASIRLAHSGGQAPRG
jgi:hypothetical protein